MEYLNVAGLDTFTALSVERVSNYTLAARARLDKLVVHLVYVFGFHFKHDHHLDLFEQVELVLGLANVTLAAHFQVCSNLVLQLSISAGHSLFSCALFPRCPRPAP